VEVVTAVVSIALGVVVGERVNDEVHAAKSSTIASAFRNRIAGMTSLSRQATLPAWAVP
jgi:hypothetical protein